MSAAPPLPTITLPVIGTITVDAVQSTLAVRGPRAATLLGIECGARSIEERARQGRNRAAAEAQADKVAKPADGFWEWRFIN